jgi:3-deoxy-D-manno-octulosonic-acid transferase
MFSTVIRCAFATAISVGAVVAVISATTFMDGVRRQNKDGNGGDDDDASTNVFLGPWTARRCRTMAAKVVFDVVSHMIVAPVHVLDRTPRSMLRSRYGQGWPFSWSGQSEVIWVHGASIGETLVACLLIEELRKRSPHATIIQTVATHVGMDAARKRESKADHVVFMPIDLTWVVWPIVLCVRPTHVVLIESGLWPNFILAAKSVGSRVSLVSGNISERSARLYASVPWLFEHITGSLDRISAKSVGQQQMFERIGIHPSRIRTIGNLKIANKPTLLATHEKKKLMERLGIESGHVVFVLGSVYHNEVIQLVESLFHACREDIGRVKIILAPRNPLHFDAITKDLCDHGIEYDRYTSDELPSPSQRKKVFVVDTVGILCDVYQLADLAVVCGSFFNDRRKKGHNIFEPVLCGIPTLFGPYMNTQEDMVKLCAEHGVGLQVDITQIASKMNDLCFGGSIQERQRMQEAARNLCGEYEHVIGNTLDWVLE